MTDPHLPDPDTARARGAAAGAARDGARRADQAAPPEKDRED